MSKPARTSEPASSSDLPFEEALKKLESIVETMESGDLPLETLLARYEEGTKLSQVCQAKLAEAGFANPAVGKDGRRKLLESLAKKFPPITAGDSRGSWN